jgi:hypothetical protein
MTTTAVVTITKMVENLPEPTQQQLVVHLREYLAELQDEIRWDTLFQNSQAQLVAAARRAKQQKAQGLAQPMDFEQL